MVEDSYPRSPQKENIYPGLGKYLHSGSWRLTLGIGLDFLIQIPPRPADQYHMFLPDVDDQISGPAPQPKGITESTNCGEKSQSEDSDVCSKEDKTKKCNVSPHSDDNQPANSDVLLSKTDITRVFKVERHGRLVAAKVCRRPELQ